MEAEKFLNLYDFSWFELQILNKQPSSVSETQEVEDQPTTPTTKTEASQPQIQIQIHHIRSMSDQLGSTSNFESPGFSSTDSSPRTQKLCTILSGKEIPGLEHSLCETEPPPKKKKSAKEKRKRRTRSEAKSLSDLEFEELKGFMDLGFVFSEKDKDSSLAEIIPGLHRLGKNNNEEEEEEEEEEKEKKEKEEERDIFGDENEGTLISRPYLSEAWKVLDLGAKKEYQNPLMKWRFPALNNEIDMKDNLRWWAHTVASTVR